MYSRSEATMAGWMPRWAPPMTGDRATPEAGSVADMASLDDRALVAAHLAGRSGAFDEIVARYRKPVYQLCYRFAGNHEDASDLAQDVFVRAFKGLARFKGESALGTWLYRIAVNTSLNRAAVKRPQLVAIDAVEHVDPATYDPLEGIVKGEVAGRVRAAIRRLPPKQQAALILRIYHDLSHDQIAETLGSSVGAVKANFFHALGNLRRVLTR
jgi:RNA polymerase sigma-70 factor, ECF subfamily